MLSPEGLSKLKTFLTSVKENSDSLHKPELLFFKTFIEWFGGTIPSASQKSESAQKPPDEEVDLDSWVSCLNHDSQNLRFYLNDETSQTTEKQANPQDRKQLIQRCIQMLGHACQCRDANCQFSSCQRMKRIVTHMEACEIKMNGNCPICQQLIALCFYYAKNCQNFINYERSTLMSTPQPLPVLNEPHKLPVTDDVSGLQNTPPSVSKNPPLPISINEVRPSLPQHVVTASNVQINLPSLKPQNPTTVVQTIDPPLASPTNDNANITSDATINDSQAVTKEWHKQINHEIKEQLIEKLICAILSISPNNQTITSDRNFTNQEMDTRPPVFDDQIMQTIESYARKVECDTYNEANSKFEYYHLIAEKYDKIIKEVDERKQKRKQKQEKQQQLQQQQSQVPQQAQPSPTLVQGQQQPSDPEVRPTLVPVHQQSESHPHFSTPSPVFKSEDLKRNFLPVLQKLCLSEESMPFREPVDPLQLGIPDYPDIIKHPIDLSTIENKLDSGKYPDPWSFVDDMWLMFDNAWLNNKKSSNVYNCCTKLAEIFELEIDPVMQSLGYCCGRKYTFSPQTLSCYGKQLCTIPRDAKYYNYQNLYTFCVKCFLEIPGDAVTLGKDQNQRQTLPKKDFTETKNDHSKIESFVECVDCGRKLHQICVLHMDQIWRSGFVCDNCLKAKNEKRVENKYTAKRLPVTKLGTYIETNVNNYLKTEEADAGEITVRIISSSEKMVQVMPRMKSRYVDTGELSEQFPYKAKALFAFQKIDGVDVCIFGMHVQEYGSECAPPNTRRVYIACLDSVHYFQPRQLRSHVNHKILLSYLDYVWQLGYTMAHIWARPMSEGDDYIFYCHPDEQKIPKPKRLQNWFIMMLDKGMVDGIVQDYKDILKQAIEDKLSSAAELPYFEGDFWPIFLEESIKELDQKEEKKRRLREIAETLFAGANNVFNKDGESEADVDGKKQSNETVEKTDESKSSLRKCITENEFNSPQLNYDLSSKIYATMEKHKEMFFVIRLHSAESAASLPPIRDPDPFISCDLMDGRDAFLTMAREKNYEFSSLRRAKFSSMAMLYEIHAQIQGEFLYKCNNCKKNVETRYHCTVCDHFDLCVSCFNDDGHPHRMEKPGFDLDDGTSQTTERLANPQEHRQETIQICIQSLVHSCQCRNAECRLPNCQHMKMVVTHSKECKMKVKSDCPICKQLITLCSYHAKRCQDEECTVPMCSSIKKTIELQQPQPRVQQQQLVRRRLAAMNRLSAPGIPPNFGAQSPVSNSGFPSSTFLHLSQQHSPHAAGMGMKSGGNNPATPNVRQELKQVQGDVVRQQAPHVHIGMGYPIGLSPVMKPQPIQWGKAQVPQATIGSVVHPSTNMSNDLWKSRYPSSFFPQPNATFGQMNPQVSRCMSSPQTTLQPTQMNAQPSADPSLVPQHQPQPIVGGPQQSMNIKLTQNNQEAANPIRTNNRQALQQLVQVLRQPSSAQQQDQIVHILKSNPPLMAAFIKQWQLLAAEAQHQTQGQPPSQPMDISKLNMQAPPQQQEHLSPGVGLPPLLADQQQMQYNSPPSQYQQWLRKKSRYGTPFANVNPNSYQQLYAQQQPNSSDMKSTPPFVFSAWQNMPDVPDNSGYAGYVPQQP